MNETKTKDFFPEIDERDAHLIAPDIYEPYLDDDDDRLHEERLKEIEAKINQKLGAEDSDDNLGELPYDEESDRQRWDELEKDFDRVFDEAKRSEP